MKALRSVVLLAAVAGSAMPALAQQAGIPTPSPGMMPSPVRGEPLFEQHCARCHGEDLQGTDKGPPFLSPIYRPAHHGDPAFQMAARYGARAHHWRFGNMPPVPGVSPDQVADITAYIRMKQRRAGID